MLSTKPPWGVAALYHWVDVDGTDLYIGITDDLAARMGDHYRRSSWTGFAASGTVTWYPAVGLARLAEIRAIGECQPLFNERENSPDVRLRLVRYLVACDRLDLLAPNIRIG